MKKLFSLSFVAITAFSSISLANATCEQVSNPKNPTRIDLEITKFNQQLYPSEAIVRGYGDRFPTYVLKGQSIQKKNNGRIDVTLFPTKPDDYDPTFIRLENYKVSKDKTETSMDRVVYGYKDGRSYQKESIKCYRNDE